MWKFYLKTALRNILKNKTFSSINIFGLSIGIASSIFIFLWVKDELSFNRKFDNADYIYRVNSEERSANGENFFGVTPLPTVPYLVDNYPEIITGTRILPMSNSVEYKEKAFYERYLHAVDTSYFTVFSYEFLHGNPQRAFHDEKSIVITNKIAEKYFEDEDPIGKVLTINGEHQFVVTAVVNGQNKHTTMPFHLLVPFEFCTTEGFDLNDWNRYSIYSYVLLNEKSYYKDVQEKITDVYIQNEDSVDYDDSYLYYAHLQSVKKERLYEPSGKMGKMLYVFVFSTLAVFILIIACINFTNLATAQATKRAKEVGIKKVVGAYRPQLVKQFFLESIIQVFIAFHIAIVIVEILRPQFNQITGKDISLNYLQLEYILASIIIIIATSFLSGFYPSIMLSSFIPIKILKGSAYIKTRKISVRKILVLFQFFISSALIISALIIYLQLYYIQNRDLGIQKENIIHFDLNDKITNNYEAFKLRLKDNPNIVNVTQAFQLPSFFGIGMTGAWEGVEGSVDFGIGVVDEEHIPTFGIQLLEGSNFSGEYSLDSNKIIINEKAAKLFKENPIGKHLSLDDGKYIAGIVKDFNYLPPTYPMKPMVLMVERDKFRTVAVKYKPGTMNTSITHIEEVFKDFCPNHNFHYDKFEDEFEYHIRDEKRMIKLIQYFTILGILISCLGLLGLSSYMAEQRTKEIGIRRVHGASIWNLFKLLNTSYLKLVALGFFTAIIPTYFVIESWLGGFVYRIDMPWWAFIVAGLVSIVIAFATMSIHAYKAAVQNPVNSLRYE